jgi:tRNA(fMet)-specific endonuclease VapC
MKRFMLDTDICIYLIKQKSRKLLDRLTNHEPGEITISAVTWSELNYGVERSDRKKKNAEALEHFILAIDVLPFDDSAAKETAQIRAALEGKGKSIGSYDTMIAGHARSRGFTLVTNNVREFSRVPSLDVENWT